MLKFIHIFYLLPLLISMGFIFPSNHEVNTNSAIDCDNCEISQIELGNYYSAMVMDGDLYTWGANSSGQLGDGTTNFKDIPTKITGENSANPDLTGEVSQVALGWYHSAMIMDGDLYTWGHNGNGQLGNGEITANANPTPLKITGVNSANPELNGEVTQIALGDAHSAMIMDGDLYTWGHNGGQLGDGTFSDKNIPTKITGEDSANPDLNGEISQIAMGGWHSAMVMDGDLWMWGSNSNGQLGDGTNSTLGKNSPIKITGVDSIHPDLNGELSQISLGEEHSAMVMDGELYMWGENNKGQLGDGTFSDKNMPTKITGEDSTNPELSDEVTQIALGGLHSAMVMDGDLWMWGDNIVGQLGNGESGLYENNPIKITGEDSVNPNFNGEISEIALGYEHSAMIMDGDLYMWGSNSWTIDEEGLSGGVIAGIVIGSLVAVALLGAGGYFVIAKR